MVNCNDDVSNNQLIDFFCYIYLIIKAKTA